MNCYENVINYKWMVNLFSDLKLRMAYHDILVDSKWQLTYLAIFNFKMACYDIVVDIEWTIDLYSDL